MALADVLNNLTGARDALVTAINGKGGSVATTATLRQCADAVTALPEGGGGGSSLLQGVSFYSSLTDVETSETADQMQMTGNVTVTSVDGVTSGNFNGSSYLEVETYKKLPKFSVCVWLNCATEMSNYGWAIASGEFNFRMEIYDAAIYATAWGANGINKDPLEGRVSTALTINTWQFIVYSFDSENYRLHKNSTLVSQAEKEKENFTPFFDNICLGGVSNSVFGRFDGNISDVIIYNRVLSDDEIAELHALGPGGFSKIWNGEISGGGSSGGGATSADLIDLIERDITSIEIPEGTTEIGSSAFYHCNLLTFLTIPNSVTLIDTNAFAGCASLENIVIPNSVTNIGLGAFNGCKALKSVEIPNSVTNIGNNAFTNCTSLTLVKIANGVTTIGNSTFTGCNSLTDIYCGFAENMVPGAPWGAPDTTTIHYNA